MSDQVRKANAESLFVQVGEDTCVARDVRPDIPQSCFFALLDILGFKNIVKQKTFEQLRKIVDTFTVGFRQTVDLSRTFGAGNGIDGLKIELGHIHVRIVSDSIYVWADGDECLKGFDDVLHVVNAMLASGFENGLPLRGVVTYGELFVGRRETSGDGSGDFAFESGSIYGKALVEAHELESQVNWSGAILTPCAWTKVVSSFKDGMVTGTNIKCPDDYFNSYPYLLWYDVPFKSGNRNAITFNWNYRSGLKLDAEKVQKAFSENAGPLDDDVKVKLDETIRFYEHTKPFSGPCDIELVKSLPTPGFGYALSGTNNK